MAPPACSNSEAYNLPFTLIEFEYALLLSTPTSSGDDILYSMLVHLLEKSKRFFVDVLNSKGASRHLYHILSTKGFVICIYASSTANTENITPKLPSWCVSVL